MKAATLERSSAKVATAETRSEVRSANHSELPLHRLRGGMPQSQPNMAFFAPDDPVLG